MNIGLQFEERLPGPVRAELVQLVAALQLTIQQLALQTPAGTVIAKASSTTPTGYLPCDGAAYPRADYPALFADIGIVFGAGDGSNTFNVPDLRGRTIIGAGTGTGLTARTLGTAVGSETHTLTTAEIPAHTHPFTTYSTGGATAVSVQNSTRDATAADTNLGGVGNNTGGGGAHNNIQPSLVLYYFIKY